MQHCTNWWIGPGRPARRGFLKSWGGRQRGLAVGTENRSIPPLQPPALPETLEKTGGATMSQMP